MIKKFTLKDLDFFTPSEDVARIDYKKLARDNYLADTWMVSYWADGAVRCIFGARIILPGVADIWQFNSNDIKSCGFKMARAVRKLMFEVLVPSYSLRRVQGICRKEKHIIRWAEFFGMQKEGTLRSLYKDGEDVEMYARLF